MGKQLTKEEFIQRAKEVWGDKFENNDYSKVEYKNVNTKVLIHCNIHDIDYPVTPQKHIDRLQGCPICAGRTIWNYRTLIQTVNEKHPHYLDDKEILNADELSVIPTEKFSIEDTNISIKCKKDGYEWIVPDYKGKSMLKGAEPRRPITLADVIGEVKEKNPKFLDSWKLIEYKDSKNILIKCNKCGHEKYEPKSRILSKTIKCPECNGGKRSKHTDESIKDKFNKASDGNWKLLDVMFGNGQYRQPKIKIQCTKCGYIVPETQFQSFVHQGYFCPNCHDGAREHTNEWFINKLKKENPEFLEKFTILNEFVNNTTPITVKCKQCGYIKSFLPISMLASKDYTCKGCTFVNRYGLPNWCMSKQEFIDWLQQHNPAVLNEIDILSDEISCEHVNKWNVHKVSAQCKKCGYIFDLTLQSLCKEHKIDIMLCPSCNKSISYKYALELLESGDLLHLTEHQLMELIAAGKIPPSLKPLVFTPADSDERIGKIDDLLSIINDRHKTDEEKQQELAQCEDENAELTQSSDVDTLLFNNDSEGSDNAKSDEDNELPSVVMSNMQLLDNIDNIEPTGDCGEYLVKDAIAIIWKSILDAAEKDRYAGPASHIVDTEIQKISEMNGSRFFTYIKNAFINEYNEVMNIKEDSDYSFPYPLSLMQKLTAYRLIHNKSFGNWCDAGAGKTNSFLFSTHLLQTHVNLVITPNNVINTFVDAVNKIYPNDNVVVPASPEDIHTYDKNEYTYIVMNYEKFQANNKGTQYISKLLETNILEFVCLDEVHNVKVRHDTTASSRSQLIKDLLIRAREFNSEMRTLAMTATVCINNLNEVRSIMELLMGEEYLEIGSIPDSNNIHNAYKALTLNGLRYIPKYPMTIEEITEDIDCTGDEELYNDLHMHRHELNAVDVILAKQKLDYIKGHISKGSVVYSGWVDDMATMLTEHIKSWGYSVETYNGESGDNEGRKEILDRFKNGTTDILVASKSIGTGIDGLQEMCNKLIMVSMPFTDADYHQLKSRFYRQGSKFDKVHIYIPQIVINEPNKQRWSYDKMRKANIDKKRSLAMAVVDGYIQRGFQISKDKLLKMAMDALDAGINDFDSNRKKIEGSDIISFTEAERKFGESFVNDIHQKANTSNSFTIHTAFTENPDKEKEYHRQREILKSHWIEDPVDRVADMIKAMSSKYTRIIDMGCGMNKLSKVVDSERVVTGVNHTNVSGDSNVIAADMVDLHEHICDNSMDIAVYCLSLWGKNYMEYFQEAYRILDVDGRMIIVEPADKFGENERRYGSIDSFVENIENCGFERLGRPEHRNNFVYFKFSK